MATWTVCPCSGPSVNSTARSAQTWALPPVTDPGSPSQEISVILVILAVTKVTSGGFDRLGSIFDSTSRGHRKTSPAMVQISSGIRTTTMIRSALRCRIRSVSVSSRSSSWCVCVSVTLSA